jgi:tetratricopeptide (TPR) repeat protein
LQAFAAGGTASPGGDVAAAPESDGARADLARGQKLFASGDVVGARAAFEAAIAKDPALALAHLWRGRACVVKGLAMSYSLAIESFTRALQLDPALCEAHWGLGVAHAGYSHAAEAEREFQAFLAAATERQPPEMRGEAEHFLGVFAREGGDVEGALARFERAERLHPRFADAPYERGVTLEKVGRSEEAVTAFRAAIAVDPDHLPSHFRLGRLLRKLGRDQEAEREERIHKLLLLLSDDLSGRTVRAPERRAELYSELAGIDAGNLRARLEYARALAELGRGDEAALALDELLRARPPLPRFAEAWVLRGQLALRAQDSRKAAAVMEELARAMPELSPSVLPAELRALWPKR